MKNLKVKLAAIALVLGAGSALASAHHAFATRKWGKDASTGIYTEVTGLSSPSGYRCQNSSNVCTEEYPTDVDPNNQANDSHPGIAQPSNTVLGTFLQ
ncbi:hypothetical protein D0C36_15915 [Mucilaginibacter conchicola]|uniref:Uncharacterized protein n=1 Tax=Mucilaginibacter conchicola TaxID=2303333 RepID=A0A372NUH1_9SPHI|nr:hypothetical protein [Mucilaginibacter conchicola]RFZ92876.1 hypothetical protein D0C36_15915 [Mucilaginibacter conchicola]